jgi:hypothetical protein
VLDSAKDMIERAYGESAVAGEHGAYPIVVQVVERGEAQAAPAGTMDWLPRSPVGALVLILLWEAAKWAVSLLAARGWIS